MTKFLTLAASLLLTTSAFAADAPATETHAVKEEGKHKTTHEHKVVKKEHVTKDEVKKEETKEDMKKDDAEATK